MKLKILSKNKEQTKNIALDLAKCLQESKVIALEGDLGSGKTTFIQGLALGLGIKSKISSPTFVIFKKYKVQNHQKLDWFYHFDLYRIENPEEIMDLGFEEIINNKHVIVAIEWAEKIKNLLPTDSLKIKIKYLNKSSRKIIFNEQT
jgi:tRNA threonylcarbamoyladenosine biosynthesis protein TsaE